MEHLNTALSSLVRYGVSDQLIEDLQTIEESCSSEGDALYDQSAIYEMRCALLCRNYTKLIWEYSHYIALIEHDHPYGVIDFFWGKNVLGAGHFKYWLNDAVELSLYVKYDEGSYKLHHDQYEFVLNPKRINLMAALTTFIVIVEPDFLSHVAIFKASINKSQIDVFSKNLKTKLDAYLDTHLQGLHQQRQGRVLLTWLQLFASAQERKHEEYGYQERSKQGTNSVLYDASVLAFWQDNADTSDGDFKRFSTVADCAYLLHQAIKIGEDQRSLEQTQSYHQDYRGENANWLLNEVSQIDDEDYLFERLMEAEPVSAVLNLAKSPLDKIKFLTNKDAEFCRRFEQAGSAITVLPMTFIRAQVFGLQQAKITEDLRATKGQNVANLIHVNEFNGFNSWLEILTDQLAKISQTRLAIVHIFFQHGHSHALTHLLDRLSEQQRDILKQHALNYSSPMTDSFLVAQLKELVPVEIKQFEKAFSKVNRTGFKALPEATQLKDYLAGDEYLCALDKLIANFLKQFTQVIKLKGDINLLEAEDAEIFSNVFMKLYDKKGIDA